MKTSTIVQRWWVLIPLGILVWLACAIFHPFEPRYEGRRLSAWAMDMDFPNWPGESQTNEPSFLEIRDRHEKAAAAIQHIGNRAAAHRAEIVQAQDSSFSDRIENWMDDRDGGIHIVPAYEKQNQGHKYHPSPGADGQTDHPGPGPVDATQGKCRCRSDGAWRNRAGCHSFIGGMHHRHKRVRSDSRNTSLASHGRSGPPRRACVDSVSQR